MNPGYKQRTLEEAQELARQVFQRAVAQHLAPTEIEELITDGVLTAGSADNGWESITNFTPEKDSHYEIELYKPSETWPYIQKSYVRILVPRDGSSEMVYFIWRPSIIEPKT